jgi:hypothetical protein
MLRRALLIALLAAVAVPIAAQVHGGLKVRTDGSPSASAPDANPTLKIAAMGKGFHLSGGPGAVLWDPCAHGQAYFQREGDLHAAEAGRQSDVLRSLLRRH